MTYQSQLGVAENELVNIKSCVVIPRSLISAEECGAGILINSIQIEAIYAPQQPHKSITNSLWSLI